MNNSEELLREIDSLRNRLSRLTEASLRIHTNLELDSVWRDVIEGALAVTGARYGGIATINNEQPQTFFTCGLTPAEHQYLGEMPERFQLFDLLMPDGEAATRIKDFHDFVSAAGMPDLQLPFPAGATIIASIRAGERIVGVIFVAKEQGDGEFTQDDEETLTLFGSQAALVVSNAHRYTDEQKARVRFETLIETSPVGVVVFDVLTGERLLFNREAARIFSTLCSPGEQVEDIRDALTLRRADGREIALADFSMNELMATAEKVRTEEIVMYVPDGRSVRILVNATPIHKEGGEVDSVVITLQDMTQVEQLERLRTELLGVVSHELRTPLTSIKGASTTLLDPTLNLRSAEVQQFHQIIDSSADRMRDLVSDLMDVANIETGTLSVNPEPTDLVSLVNQARNIFLSGNVRHNLQFYISPQMPLLMADKQRIVQVLTNLLTNAVNHSSSSTPIQIGATQKGVYVEVSVSDKGVGITADRLPHLFRRFSREQTDEWRAEFRGSGFGLAICKGIVEAHGGRIWAESDGPGMGTRFAFTLPVAASEETRVRGKPDWLAPTPYSLDEAPRVLAVDDDPGTLRYVRDALARAGYVPIVTSDPRGAVRLMSENDPDLLLLDMRLPETDGVELMRELLAISNVPVIFLSAYGEAEIVTRAFEMGATDYMVKPFSPAELTARIGAALQRQADKALPPPEPFEIGELRVNYAARRVTLSGNLVSLTDIEYRMLVELSMSAGHVLTYAQILRRVWHRESADLRPVRTVVKSLRRKLGDNAINPQYLYTEPRVGYRMAGGDD